MKSEGEERSATSVHSVRGSDGGAVESDYVLCSLAKTYRLRVLRREGESCHVLARNKIPRDDLHVQAKERSKSNERRVSLTSAAHP